MRIITKREAIKSAIKQWLENYKGSPETRPTGWDASRTFGQARAAVRLLDAETCTPSDFAAATGLPTGEIGWCRNGCDECGGDFEEIVRIGSEPDYDAQWQDLCAGCLRKALAMVTVP